MSDDVAVTFASNNYEVIISKSANILVLENIIANLSSEKGIAIETNKLGKRF